MQYESTIQLRVYSWTNEDKWLLNFVINQAFALCSDNCDLFSAQYCSYNVSIFVTIIHTIFVGTRKNT